MGNIFDILTQFNEKVSERQQDNRESQTEKTAAGSIFDNIRQKMNEFQNRKETKSNDMGMGNPFEVFKNKVNEAQDENRANPNEDTAEASVFDKMRAEIERMERESKESKAAPVVASTTGSFDEGYTSNIPVETKYDEIYNEVAARTISVGGSATIESGGGSLALRMSPDMGAAKNSTRVPSGANIRVLDQNSENKINLDGELTGWYKVDYNGQQGWILESYLK